MDTNIDTGVEVANAESEKEEDSIQRSFLWGHGGFSMVPGGDYPVLEALIRIRLDREEFDQIDEMLRIYLESCKDPELWDNLLRYVPYLHPNNALRRAALLEQLFTEDSSSHRNKRGSTCCRKRALVECGVCRLPS